MATKPSSPRPLSRRLHDRLIDDDATDPDELPDEVAAAVPYNSVRQVTALTLQNVGDTVVDAKTVLTWLLAATGAPASFVGLLVPIRDAGSMAPQLLMAPFVRRLAVRKWVWIGGALVQAVAVVAMAAVTATATGVAAGVGILAALTVFAVARAATSFASKDVLGRTLPKGVRGQINGLATVGAGIAAITLGVGMRLLGGQDTAPVTFAWLLVGAAATWVLAAAVFSRVREAPGEHDPDADLAAVRGALATLRDDPPFRRFVLARSLLLVSALSPPFVVSLASDRGDAGLQGLAAFVISTGIASLVAGRFWGVRSDRSSRRTMQLAAGGSSAVIVVFVVALQVDALAELTLLYPATYLLLAIAHTGSRIGRKTYVIDLAEGNRRTDHIAVSNTIMGLILLVTGALTAAIATAGAVPALLTLALLGVAGVLVAARLPEVSAGDASDRG